MILQVNDFNDVVGVISRLELTHDALVQSTNRTAFTSTHLGGEALGADTGRTVAIDLLRDRMSSTLTLRGSLSTASVSAVST